MRGWNAAAIERNRGGAEGTHFVYAVGLAHLTDVYIEQDFLHSFCGSICSVTLSVCVTAP
jgi:hypothetical protein